MKVITQLIRHFWQRGLFSEAEAQYLLEHGFARPRDLPGFAMPEEAEDSWGRPFELDGAVEPPGALDAVEDELRGKKTGRGPRDAKAKAVTDRQLRQRVRREFHEREQPLAAALALAQRIEPCDEWSQAFAVLRRAEQPQFQTECLGVLDSRPNALRDLWRALDLQPLFSLVARNECLGRVAQSYFALLVMEDPALLGKYGWLLQYDEMQSISNLRVAHRRLLEMLGSIHASQPRRITLAIAGNSEPVLFWALVLLHNARRTPTDSFDPAREYGPLAPPEDAVWSQAWTEAAGMDRKALSPFLISCFSKRSAKQAAGWTKPLYCPVGWREPPPRNSANETIA